MFKKQNSIEAYCRKHAEVVICVLLFVVATIPIARAQDPSTTAEEKQMRQLVELHTIPGKVVAEGTPTRTFVQSPVERYVVEELNFAQPITSAVDGQKTEVRQAYRITLFGGPFDVRALPPILMIDDKTSLFGVEAPKLDKVTFILLERSLLAEGARLTVGYGAGTILTDKLRLSSKINKQKSKI